jgi:hypothetical protein
VYYRTLKRSAANRLLLHLAIETILRHQCLKGHKARTIKVAGLDRTEHGGEAF